MKVCLVSAPTANEFDDPQIVESEAVRSVAEHAPLGILSLAGVLEREGLKPEIVDLNRLYYDWLHSGGSPRHEGDFTKYAARHLAECAFDFLGFSTICSSYPLTLRIAGEAKRLHPGATVALGGPQASAVDAETMNAYSFIDVILRGEAEQSLPAVLNALDSGGRPSGVPGVTYRSGGAIIRNENGPPIPDLDTLPFPAFHLYPHMEKCTYAPVELGRGCPFACTFCSTNDFFRRRFRLKTPQRILAEMRRVKDAYGIQNFDLVHDIFTVDRKRVVAFCNAVLDSGEKFRWGCSARTDCIDDELIELMARAGCRGIFFGIETGSARLQKVIHKGLDLVEAAQRIPPCDRLQVKTAVSLITGFPEETMDDLRDTVDFFMDSLRYDCADPQLCLLAPLADTPIYREHKNELIFDDVISDMSFQGWKQDPEDLRMIAGHPDIFPNFYSVPTPFLDRQLINELREFVLSGMRVFRWLLVGLHQDSGNLIDVFNQWRQWRASHKNPTPDENVRFYYTQPTFHREFLEFVRSCYLPSSSRARVAISTLTGYEATFTPEARESQAQAPSNGQCEDAGGLVSLDSRPSVARGVHVTQLDADYHAIVELLRLKSPITSVPIRKVTVVTHENRNRCTEILQLSPASSQLLLLCGERKTVREIAAELPSCALQVLGVPDEKVCLFGIEVLRREGLVDLEAPAETAAALSGA